MSKVYPRAPDQAPDFIALDSEAACAARVIQTKEDGLSRAEAAGICLAGSDDVATFNRLWKEVDAQAALARSVSPADHDTVGKFKAALSVAAPLLDSTTWYNGLKAEKKVTSYPDLAAKFAPEVEAAVVPKE